MSFEMPKKNRNDLQRLKQSVRRKVTRKERFEQKVSFVYGQLGTDSKLTKAQVRKQLLKNKTP